MYVNVDFTKIPLNVVKSKFRDFYGFTFLLLLNNIGTTLDRPRKKEILSADTKHKYYIAWLPSQFAIVI